MRAPLVFIHGWGFNASLWRDILAQLPDMPSLVIDLGYIGEPATSQLELPDKAIIVGHSLGVLWALKNATKQPVGLISICGFDRFSPPVSRAALEIMKRGLKRKPMAQMTHFWRSCGIAPFAQSGELDQSALAQGLDGLMNWDGREEREKLSCPVLALASRDDEIVPQEMSSEIWGDGNINWSENGGHALPLTRPDWCAKQIRNFVESDE